MTGVISEYRSKGVATFLKLKTIGYARDHSWFETRTVNDGGNSAVFALNSKLGFKR